MTPRFTDATRPPFRIGTTSFIVPAPMLDNVARLAPRVDDVELLLFDIEEDLPGEEEVRALTRLAREHRLSYTVHTPLDASLASADEGHRRRGVDKVRRAIAWGRPLDPYAYTVHVYLGEREHDPAPPTDLEAWRARAATSLGALCDGGVESRRLCVECIDYDFALIAPVVLGLDLGVALDLGHLLRDRRDLRRAVDEWLPRARVLQLHGTEPSGRDHKSLRHANEAELAWLLETLTVRGWNGVLTLEVFAEADLTESLAIVERLLVL